MRSGDDIECVGDVGQPARHGPAGGEVDPTGRVAADGDATKRCLHAGQSAQGRRNPNRSAAIGAGGHRHHARGDRGRTATRRPTRGMRQRPRVGRASKDQVVGVALPAVLRRVRLADHHRAGGAKAGDLHRIGLGRWIAGEQAGAIARDEAGRGFEILDTDRDAGERTDRLAGRDSIVDTRGFREGALAVDGDERVHLRVDALDAVKGVSDKLAGADALGSHRVGQAAQRLGPKVHGGQASPPFRPGRFDTAVPPSPIIMAMIEGIDLDHVAIAMDDVALGWPRYRAELSGVWLGGGETPGFYCCQLQYANGMKLELLHPSRVDENDFLARFLVRSGPGPHHLTFKVPDLPAALEEVRATGLEPVAVNLDDPLVERSVPPPEGRPWHRRAARREPRRVRAGA